MAWIIEQVLGDQVERLRERGIERDQRTDPRVELLAVIDATLSAVRIGRRLRDTLGERLLEQPDADLHAIAFADPYDPEDGEVIVRGGIAESTGDSDQIDAMRELEALRDVALAEP